jgi:hypothetical protein
MVMLFPFDLCLIRLLTHTLAHFYTTLWHDPLDDRIAYAIFLLY